MRPDLILLIIVVIVDIALVLEVLFFIVRRNASNTLIRCAFENDEEGFERASASLFSKTLSDFDKKLIRYNVAEIRKDYPKMETLIREFDEMDLKDGQKKKIYPKIFYYYIDRGRKQEARAIYEKLNAFSVYKNKKEIDMSYDTYVNEGYQYLEEAERSLKRTEKRDLPYKERLIAKMYENKGINAEAKKYRRMAERHENELTQRK